MNRKYDTARYKESVDLLNGFFSRPAVTTDLIVGFPGETEEEFTATLDFIRAAIAEELHRAYLEGCVGQVYDVLYEQPAEGLYQGHAPNYMVAAVRGGDLHNRVLPTKITGVEGGVLLGELAD